ncbi:helix-turn-helix domain-containing protein [Alicyclobacillus fastidiosus]|uniref:Helix-turn-helix domain-containing protein n=1 Tax=Alicyclobacillus fastidiosus TaxID=392011 RepID=A0ABV5ABA1_9BACL|nr:helix-turn-helix domain-containing protein [Alicyclobacillus fastidiosus]WEH07730.1 helix-turn-helix domain-containing protein [Alicyclobacillus fastidiosus]
MEDLLTIDEVFTLLNKAGVTSSVQMTRTWVREGKIPGGMMPKGARNRKEGWRVPRESVLAFIRSRRPEQAELERLQAEVQRLTIELVSIRRRSAQWIAHDTRLAAAKATVREALEDVTVHVPHVKAHVQMVEDVLLGSLHNFNHRQLNLLCETLLQSASQILELGSPDHPVDDSSIAE